MVPSTATTRRRQEALFTAHDILLHLGVSNLTMRSTLRRCKYWAWESNVLLHNLNLYFILFVHKKRALGLLSRRSNFQSDLSTYLGTLELNLEHKNAATSRHDDTSMRHASWIPLIRDPCAASHALCRRRTRYFDGSAIRSTFAPLWMVKAAALRITRLWLGA